MTWSTDHNTDIPWASSAAASRENTRNDALFYKNVTLVVHKKRPKTKVMLTRRLLGDCDTTHWDTTVIPRCVSVYRAFRRQGGVRGKSNVAATGWDWFSSVGVVQRYSYSQCYRQLSANRHVTRCIMVFWEKPVGIEHIQTSTFLQVFSGQRFFTNYLFSCFFYKE